MPLTAKPTVYLASPRSARIGFLVRVLREKGLDVRRAMDVAPSSRSPPESLRRSIIGSNYVIAVLEANRDNANAYFELGIALGHGMPVLVLADPKINDFPPALDGLLIFRLTTEKVKPMALAVEQFLAAAEPPKTKPRPDAKRKTRPIGSTADLRVAELSSAHTGLDLVRILSSAITESGAQTVIADQASTTRVDIAVVASDLNSLGLNPLAIEVKMRLPDRSELRHAVDQLEHYLDESNARAGLVVYREGLHDALASEASSPRVALVSAAGLLDRMREHGSATVVRQLFETKMPSAEGSLSDGLR